MALQFLLFPHYIIGHQCEAFTTLVGDNVSCETLFLDIDTKVELSITGGSSVQRTGDSIYFDGLIFRYPQSKIDSQKAAPRVATVANVVSGAAKGDEMTLLDVDRIVSAASRALAATSSNRSERATAACTGCLASASRAIPTAPMSYLGGA